MDAWTDRSLRGAHLHWLVEVIFAGQTIRVADDHLDVVTEDGESLHFDGALLDPVEVTSSDEGQAGAAVRCLWPDDIALLTARGHDLAGCDATISLWAEGTTYEERRTVLSGRVSDPEWGADGEPVAFSVEMGIGEDACLVPDPSLVLDTTAWPDVASDAVGVVMPLIIGQPGNLGATAVPGSRAYPVVQTVGAQKLLIAGHAVDATSVLVYATRGEETLTAVCSVTEEQDGLGRTVATVDISAEVATFADGVTEFRDATNTFYISWGSAGGGAGGGIVDYRYDGGLRRAGRVIEYLLGRSSVEWDRGKTASARAFLDQFLIDTVIEEPVSPVEWITANLLPILPISLVVGPSGLYPLVWRYGATAADAVRHLDVDATPDAERIGPISASTSDVANKLDLRYGLNIQTGDMARHALVSAERDASDSATSEVLSCRISRARYGERVYGAESHVVSDPATAGKVVAWWAQARCYPVRTLVYAWPQADAGTLTIGDVVTLTDDEIYLDEQVCLVEGIGWGESERIEITLRIVESTSRDRRS